MAQFDVHILREGTLVVNAQSDLVFTTGTTFVIPLVPPDDDARKTERLNPVIAIEGDQYLLATHLAGAISTSAIGRRRCSLDDQEYVIKAALDMLISGY